ncbi:MAG: methyl-accepting chemotaxis protein [Sedimentibacter sp.]|nr:methyl-accepting chemotaxis protein [Sedimentibacter sp.]
MYKKVQELKINKTVNLKSINTFFKGLKILTLDRTKSKEAEASDDKKIRFNDFKLGTKLTISFVVLILLFIVPVSISLYNFNETAELLRKTNEVAIPEIYIASSVSKNLKDIEKNLYASTLTDNITKKEEYSVISNDLFNQMTSDMKELENLLVNDSAKVKDTLKLLEKESAIRDEVMNLKYKSDATRLIFNSYEPVVNNINKNLNDITDGINLRLQEGANESSRNVRFSFLLTVSMTLSAVLLGSIITRIITGSIVTPISEIEGLAKALSDGDLNYKITYTSKNELGKLAENMKKSMNTLTLYIKEIDEVMSEISRGNLNVKISQRFTGDFEKIEHSIMESVHMLSKTIKSINGLSSEVSKKSENISLSSQQISKGATEQASSIEESSAAIEEISVHVKDNAKNTSIASNNLITIGNEITFCNERMEDMVAAMTEIKNKSNEVGKIIKLIDDIAFQTNILALNAAVEAAHAGSAGKGFAVVADEVRNLAARSSEAAKNTSSLIEETIKAVLNGNEIADKTALSLKNIVVSSKDAAYTVEEISKASEEQSVAIEQIKVGVEQIAAVVQLNSAAADKASEASDDLFTQANALNELVCGFSF